MDRRAEDTVVGTFAAWTHMPLDVLAALQLHMSPQK